MEKGEQNHHPEILLLLLFSHLCCLLLPPLRFSEAFPRLPKSPQSKASSFLPSFLVFGIHARQEEATDVNALLSLFFIQTAEEIRFSPMLIRSTAVRPLSPFWKFLYEYYNENFLMQSEVLPACFLLPLLYPNARFLSMPQKLLCQFMGKNVVLGREEGGTENSLLLLLTLRCRHKSQPPILSLQSSWGSSFSFSVIRERRSLAFLSPWYCVFCSEKKRGEEEKKG